MPLNNVINLFQILADFLGNIISNNSLSSIISRNFCTKNRKKILLLLLFCSSKKFREVAEVIYIYFWNNKSFTKLTKPDYLKTLVLTRSSVTQMKYFVFLLSRSTCPVPIKDFGFPKKFFICCHASARSRIRSCKRSENSMFRCIFL